MGIPEKVCSPPIRGYQRNRRPVSAVGQSLLALFLPVFLLVVLFLSTRLNVDKLLLFYSSISLHIQTILFLITQISSSRAAMAFVEL